MKIKFILTAILVVLCCSCQNKEKEMQTFVQSYLARYPKATLVDIYKGNFQDKFGPAHLLTDRDAVETSIIKELQRAQSLEIDYYQPCGWKGNFYQVNLSVIRDRKVSLDEFIHAFMASANGIDTTLNASWVKEWEIIQRAVRTVAPDLKGFKEDSTLLANMLKEGKYVVHHSPVFNANYQPHYRIIRKDYFEKTILPKLK